MGDWDSTVLTGPEGEDWRVPVSELEARLERLAQALRVAALPGALIQHPVDLYYFAGGRQDGSLFVPADGSEGDGPIFFVRRSLERARFEAGGENAPFLLEPFPRLREFADILKAKEHMVHQDCSLENSLRHSHNDLPLPFRLSVNAKM